MDMRQFTNCNRCGKELGGSYCIVRNNYPVCGFPHDTEHRLCSTCYTKFEKYMTKQYDKFFKKDGDK